MSVPRLPLAIEMKIVALLARGDKYETIRDIIEQEEGRRISKAVITATKARNTTTLTTIREAIIQKEKDDAEGLLARSHRLIGRQLREAERTGEPVKLTDLTSISKEMFHQTRIDKGLDDAPPKLTDPKEKLKELQTLLDENDEIRLERIVFAKREQTTGVYAGSDEIERTQRPEDGSSVQGDDLHSRNQPNPSEAQV